MIANRIACRVKYLKTRFEDYCNGPGLKQDGDREIRKGEGLKKICEGRI